MRTKTHFKLPHYKILIFIGLSVCLVGFLTANKPITQQEMDIEACADCHEDIAKAFMSKPHAVTNSCTGCHGDAETHLEEGGGPNIFAFSKEDLAPAKANKCITCHLDSNSRYLASPHGKAALDCTTCHSVHGHTTEKNMLKMNETKGCSVCHEDVSSQFQLNERHRLQEGVMECTTCHDPHSRLPFKGRATYSMTRQDMSISHVREATQVYGYMSTDDWNNGGGDLNCQGACHPLSYNKRYYYQLGTEPPEAFKFLTNLDAGADVSSPQSGTGGVLLGGSFDGYTGVFGGAQTGLRVDADGEGATFPTSNINGSNGVYGETIAFWYVPDFNLSDKAGTGEVETLFHSYVDGSNWIRIQAYNNKLQFHIVTGGSTHYLRTAGLDWLAGEPHYIV